MYATVILILFILALDATRQEDVMPVAVQVLVADVMGLDGFGFAKFVTKLELFA